MGGGRVGLFECEFTEGFLLDETFEVMWELFVLYHPASKAKKIVGSFQNISDLCWLLDPNDVMKAMRMLIFNVL